MAYMITDDCASCAACVDECPNEAISEGDGKYDIDPDKCTECVGFHSEAQCVEACPSEAIVKDPNHKESQDELLAKFAKLHPGKTPA
ncbi:MAG: YfhL family 4Fe-4S dicluster ferredoxin [Phycisphaerae bacterium]|nr:YfhL family 4Fe-4S dicluster ferredoxin [Phycisphaerae bacterium]